VDEFLTSSALISSFVQFNGEGCGGVLAQPRDDIAIKLASVRASNADDLSKLWVETAHDCIPRFFGSLPPINTWAFNFCNSTTGQTPRLGRLPVGFEFLMKMSRGSD